MWFISPFVPIFFRPSDDMFGVSSKYTQKFATDDHVLLEVLSSGTEAAPILKLNDICSGDSQILEWNSWQMNEKKILYYYVLTDLECSIYNVHIGDRKSEPFQITNDERELEETTLIKYSMRNNRMRLDGVFWIDEVQYFFEFRVPGGFKDDDRKFSVDNEQFVSPYGNIVEMYSMDSTQKVFTLGNSMGCPIWFGELLNRLLCCTHVYFGGVQFARKDSSIPEMTQGVVGIKSYIFKQTLQEVKDDLSVMFGEEGGGIPGGGGSGGGIDILRLVDDEREPTDSNVFSALRTLYEIKFYCEYYAKEYDKKYLRKDQADGTSYTLSIGKDLKFGDFLTMIRGGYIDAKGDGELNSLVLRDHLSVPEIRYNRITYFEGYNLISPGGGFRIDEVRDNGDGSYTITPDREEGEPIGQYVDDILLGYWHNKTATGDFAGFQKVQFRVSSVDYDAKTFILIPRPDTNSVPLKNMRLGQTGNFTNEERQTYTIIDTRDGNNCITFYDNANTWDVEPAQEMSWFGKKKGRTVHGIPADNYSAVLQNIIMSGKIFQVDDITGEAFRVPLNKGAWKSGVKNAYYDEVTHNGSSWICVNPVGTTSEPSDTNPDWLKYVSKGHDGLNGTDGKDGTGITNCGDWHTGLHVPYMGMTKMYGRVFLCKNSAGTDNPPMWTVTTKDGNRILQTQDGGKTYGYIITGELNTAEYELLVENGKDGRDGTDHEWIFKHTTENVAPSTPGTSQVDDYVPSGWHDDAIGVSESLPYEWACSRTKKDGVWSAFTPAAIWAKWGFDGESVIVADIDNEMESVPLTYEGKTTASTVLNTTVGMWYGTKKLQLKSISCTTPSHVTESYNINTGIIAFTVASGVSMPERCQVKITVTAAVNGTDISRELIFTIAGVRAGNPGTDAVLYRLVPSASSVRKKKDGTYSVASVSCTRTKSVGGTTAITTDGVLKYSKDGGSETEIQNGTAISPNNFSTSLQFVYYINGQVVDRETIPMVVDGTDGGKGDAGTSVKAGGEWRTANTPITALTICTMGGSSWLSKVTTSNPPMWTVTTKDGNRILQTQDGGKTYGYIITGELNTAEWELLTESGSMVYLISTCSNIRVSNAGSLVPSAFKVYAKRTLGSTTLPYSDGYIAARGYSNGVWTSIAGPARSSEMTVNASAGYSTFSVRCYQTQADASAWNDSFIAEQSVGVSYDGGIGRTGSEPRSRGLFTTGNTYVWNDQYHDIVLATFNNRTIPFRIRAYGASVTVAPSSIDGDVNWEPAQQFQFVATDLLLSRQIRADEIYTDDLVVQNVLARNKAGEVTTTIDGETGKLTSKSAEITGRVSTMANGMRIEMNPDTNSLKMYNQGNIDILSMEFIEYETKPGTGKLYIPRLRLRQISSGDASETAISGNNIYISSSYLGDTYTCVLNPTYGLAFQKNGVETKVYSKS